MGMHLKGYQYCAGKQVKKEETAAKPVSGEAEIAGVSANLLHRCSWPFYADAELACSRAWVTVLAPDMAGGWLVMRLLCGYCASGSVARLCLSTVPHFWELPEACKHET